jgi:ubiquinone/menaquinone biosynthesis C-methylase UbiE
MVTPAEYSGGYSSLIIEQFKQRTLATQGAFVLPHLGPGLAVLDCGCGPGSITLDIADLVQPGQVFALDHSTLQINQARLLQRQRATANVTFITGSAYAMPATPAT